MSGKLGYGVKVILTCLFSLFTKLGASNVIVRKLGY